MHRRTRTTSWLLHAGFAAAWAACAATATAQRAPTAVDAASLKQVFDAAWARQPEALALQARRDAARARQRAAQGWTPEPAALALSNKTGRFNRDQGARELEVGVAVPIWLPGERSGSAALADAEGAATESRAAAAQLRVAAAVREAWWQGQRTRIDAESAREHLANARLIAADVARRTRAGDLARADLHQADGAVAAAESALEPAEAQFGAARRQLGALSGGPALANDASDSAAEPDPDVQADALAADVDAHATLQDLKDRVAVAERTATLTAAQSRASPELSLAATRERDAFGASSQRTLTLGVRIPFGGGPRHDARTAGARAEATEARAQWALERERLLAEHDAARARVDAARRQLVSAERRARLARESRGFFDTAFRLGETDLPTRLRIEAEAAEAGRQAARTRIELAAAVSAWRQALGLLPR